MRHRPSREARIAFDLACVVLIIVSIYVLAVCAFAFNGGTP